MWTFKHLVSRPFAALYRSIVGYGPFMLAPTSAMDAVKVVETSRYTHATNRLWGGRVYMSKSAAVYSGTTVTTSEVRRGDSSITLHLAEAGRCVKTLSLTVADAKAIAATLAAACMVADPKTGQRMDRSEWKTLEEATANAKGQAQYQASLFD